MGREWEEYIGKDYGRNSVHKLPKYLLVMGGLFTLAMTALYGYFALQRDSFDDCVLNTPAFLLFLSCVAVQYLAPFALLAGLAKGGVWWWEWWARRSGAAGDGPTVRPPDEAGADGAGKMRKLPGILLRGGGVVALVVGILFGYMALHHDPQQVYSSDPLYLLSLQLLTMAFVMALFAVLAWVARGLRRRLRSSRDSISISRP